MQKILVWDVPTRVGHWLLASAFIVALATGDSEAQRLVHVTIGLAFAGVLAFRLFWGAAGTRYARFASFFFSPREVVAYVRGLLQGSPAHWVGHNPAGSYVIYLLLSLGMVVAGSGVLVYADIGGDWLQELHDAASYFMLGTIGVHVAGVVVSSLLHHENLVRSMFDGYKQGTGAQAIASGKSVWVLWLLGSALSASLLVLVL